jgi:hypothetical protein
MRASVDNLPMAIAGGTTDKACVCVTGDLPGKQGDQNPRSGEWSQSDA